MTKKILLSLIILFLLPCYLFAQGKRTVSLENPLNRNFPHAPTVIKRAELNLMPDETVAAVKIERGRSSWSVPFQLDDIDDDGNWDELFFQVSFKPLQKIEAEVLLGPRTENNPVFPMRVDAVIDESPRKPWIVHKPLWESELMTYLTYGPTQIDMIGKTFHRLSLDYFYGKVKHSQHIFSPEYGQDFFATENTMALHSVFIREAGGKIERPWTTNGYSITKKIKRDADYSFKIIANGPLRIIIKNVVTNWQTDEGTYSFEITYSIASEKRYTKVDLKMLKYPGKAGSVQFGAGMKQFYQDFYHRKTPEYLTAIAKDVYEAGTLNHLIARAIITGKKYRTREIYIKNDPDLNDIPLNGPNYGILFPKGKLELKYAFAGAWEKDGGVSSVEQWKKYLEQTAAEIDNPVEIISIKK